ncbi:MAG: methyltransferase domain-containing protein [archaeon]
MIEIKPYRYESFFEKIPFLENKKLLDVAAGCLCDYALFGYLSCLHKQNTQKRKVLDGLSNSDIDYMDNIIAMDLEYGHKIDSCIPERSLCADAQNMPFGNKIFDIVAIGYLLDLLLDSEVESVVRECARVLKPDGYLVGDVLLHPETLHVGSDLHICLKPEHELEQLRYKNIIELNGLKILDANIGYNSQILEKSLLFYFIAQKS